MIPFLFCLLFFSFCFSRDSCISLRDAMVFEGDMFGMFGSMIMVGNNNYAAGR